MRIDGKFRFSNVDAFVRLLQQAFPVQVDRHGDEIVLRSR
jgi:transmembrane sensor